MIKIAYLGPNTFTEQALKKYCKEKNLTVSAVKCSSIAEIVQSAKNGSDCGVLPFRE